MCWLNDFPLLSFILLFCLKFPVVVGTLVRSFLWSLSLANVITYTCHHLSFMKCAAFIRFWYTHTGTLAPMQKQLTKAHIISALLLHVRHLSLFIIWLLHYLFYFVFSFHFVKVGSTLNARMFAQFSYHCLKRMVCSRSGTSGKWWLGILAWSRRGICVHKWGFAHHIHIDESQTSFFYEFRIRNGKIILQRYIHQNISQW